MKVSYKAALMSGFVFPGAGYLSLKLYRRGAVIISLSIIFFYGLVQTSMMKAQAITDLLLEGKVAPDMPSMLKALEDISSLSIGWQDYAGYGFMLCWAVSVFDAIRLTKKA